MLRILPKFIHRFLSAILLGVIAGGMGCQQESASPGATMDADAATDGAQHVPHLVTDPELLTPEQASVEALPPAQRSFTDPDLAPETLPAPTAQTPEEIMAEVMAEFAQDEAAAEAAETAIEADPETASHASQAAMLLRGATAEDYGLADRFQPEPEGTTLSETAEAEATEAEVAEVVADGAVAADALVARLEAKLDERDAEVAALQSEVGALREDLRQLGESLDIYLGAIMADLREENQVLRQEMRRLYARDTEGAPITFSDVPRPHGEMLDEILYQEELEYAEALEAQAREAAAPPPFRFDVLEEWGRSPEAAAEADIASLKGIIGVVPAGSAREDVESLARELRAEYDNHDNINIEIFDNSAAAQQFAERGATDPNHRIISISKYGASGRDVILYFEHGEPTVIEGEGVAEEGPSGDELEALLAEES